MRKPVVVRRVRDEIRAAFKLSPVLLGALLFVLLVWRIDSTATSGLFQSPPAGTPTAELTPPVPPETPTLGPAQTPTVAVTPTLTPELPPVVSTEGPTAELTATSMPVEGLPTAAPVPSPTDESEGRQRYPEDESNLQFEWGMLFDSAALFFSYAWLCCGVLLFLAIPIVFIVLWVASRRRRQQEE